MNEKGFTLIELIISIVLIGIAASLLLTMHGTGLVRSSDPLNILNDNYTVIQGIEKVNADYRDRLNADAGTHISIYNVNDLSTVVNGLSPGLVSGTATSFSAPDANRKVRELAAAGNRYVRITATRNNSRVITLIGNGN